MSRDSFAGDAPAKQTGARREHRLQCGNSKTIAVIRGIGGRKTFVLLAAAVACGAAVWRYQFAGGESAARKSVGEESRRANSAVSVRVATARLADVPVAINAVGTVQAMNMVTVRTQVDGQLMKLAFAEGQEVKKGDVLAQIDPSLYQAQSDQAIAKKAQDEANLLNARLDLTRYERLIAGNFASKQQYSTQKALVTQLEAQVRADAAAMNSAKTTLDFSTIRSMIDGRVGIRMVDAGNILHTIDQTRNRRHHAIEADLRHFHAASAGAARIEEGRGDGERGGQGFRPG